MVIWILYIKSLGGKYLFCTLFLNMFGSESVYGFQGVINYNRVLLRCIKNS